MECGCYGGYCVERAVGQCTVPTWLTTSFARFKIKMCVDLVKDLFVMQSQPNQDQGCGLGRRDRLDAKTTNKTRAWLQFYLMVLIPISVLFIH
jgi:hypothetical protein